MGGGGEARLGQPAVGGSDNKAVPTLSASQLHLRG